MILMLSQFIDQISYFHDYLNLSQGLKLMSNPKIKLSPSNEVC